MCDLFNNKPTTKPKTIIGLDDGEHWCQGMAELQTEKEQMIKELEGILFDHIQTDSYAYDPIETLISKYKGE